MSWKRRGRQEHGYFGSGTCDKGDNATAAAVMHVAYAALGLLLPPERRPYESWLSQGGLRQLRSTVPAWVGGSGLDRGAFHERFFGPSASLPVAAHARDMAIGIAQALPGPAGNSARLAAARPLAELVRAVGPNRRGRMMVAAQDRAARAMGRRSPGPGASPAKPRLPLAEQNVQDLAALLQTEAVGEGRNGMAAAAPQP